MGSFVIIAPDGTVIFTVAALAWPIFNCIVAGATSIAALVLIWHFRRFIGLFFIWLLTKGL